MKDSDPVEDSDLDEILEYYHYGIFVPMERLRFSLGYIFYPVIKFFVDWLLTFQVKAWYNGR